MHEFDVIVLGAGAAGLFCAGIAGQRGLRVLLLDHAPKVGEKIRISGGGRCNFTNIDCGAANFISGNPSFCRSALARFTPQDFIALVRRHGINIIHARSRAPAWSAERTEMRVPSRAAMREQIARPRPKPCRRSRSVFATW